MRRQIAKEISKTKEEIEAGMADLFRGDKQEISFITKIPCDGLDRQDIINMVAEYLELGNQSFAYNLQGYS